MTACVLECKYAGEQTLCAVSWAEGGCQRSHTFDSAGCQFSVSLVQHVSRPVTQLIRQLMARAWHTQQPRLNAWRWLIKRIGWNTSPQTLPGTFCMTSCDSLSTSRCKSCVVFLGNVLKLQFISSFCNRYNCYLGKMFSPQFYDSLRRGSLPLAPHPQLAS